MSNPILDELFIVLGVQSPFLIFCCYGILKRWLSWVANPKLVFPLVGFTCSSFYVIRAFNIHFLIAGGLILFAYSALAFDFKYSKLDSLVMSSLTIIAIDQLWQIPLYIHNYSFFLGIITYAGWSLMSLPLIFYYIIRATQKVRFDLFSKRIFFVALAFTCWDILLYVPSLSSVWVWYDPYFLVFAWFIFFIAVFRSSSPKTAQVVLL